MDVVNKNVGWRTVLLVQFQPQYVGIILGGTFTLIYTAMKEFSEVYIAKNLQENGNEITISFELIYLFDLITMSIYRMSNWVEAKQVYPARKTLFICFEFLIWFFFPVTYIYNFASGEKDLTYYALRLTVVLRVVRIALYFWRIRNQVGNAPFWSIVKEYFAINVFYMVLVNLILIVLMSNENLNIDNFLDTLYHTISALTGKGIPMTQNVPYQAMLPILLFTFVAYMMYIFYVGSFITALTYNMKDYFSFIKSLERIMDIVKQKQYQSLQLHDTIKKYYLDTWKSRGSLRRVDTFEYIIPEIMSKEIKLDICWDSFKHSHVFRNMETHYLRYLSTLSKVTFFTQNELIYKKGKFKSKMVYIISGAVQLLSEEDGETPILSFSGGTCLGETTLFVNNISTCTVASKTFTEAIVLERKDFFASQKLYPDEYHYLLKEVQKRYHDAKAFMLINQYQMKERDENLDRRPLLTMRWLQKTLYRMLNMDQKRKHIATVNIDDRVHESNFEHMIFCSEFLDLMVISNEYQLNTDKIMLRHKFPLIFQPNTSILLIWEFFVGFLALSLLTSYIFYVCVSEEMVNPYTLFMYFVTAIWFFDLCIQASTAVITKDLVIAEVPKIITHCFSNPIFFLDIVAAVPIEIIWYVLVSDPSVYAYHMIKLNRLLKCYRVLQLFDMKRVSTSHRIVTLKYMKLFICSLLLIMNLAGILYLSMCPLGKCDQHFQEYLIRRLVHIKNKFKILIICHFLSVQFIGGLVWGYYPANRSNYYIAFQFLWYFAEMYLLADVAAAEMQKNKTKIKYHEFVSNVNIIMKQWDFSKEFTKRVKKYCVLQWKYNNASYLLYQEKIMANIPFDLYKIGQHISFARCLTRVPLFQNLSDDILAMICIQLERSVIPPGEVITYSGEVCKEMYVIESGYCEMIAQSRTTAKVLGPGDSFSVIESCLNVSTINTVITLTDCKVLSLSNENFLQCMRHFPQVLKEINTILSGIDWVNFEQLLSKHFLDIESYTAEVKSYYNFGYQLDKDSKAFHEYHLPYNKKPAFRIFKGLLQRVTIKPHGNFIRYWEWSRCFFAILTCLLNPFPMFCCTNLKGAKVFLMILDITAWIDIYLRHHISYFNELGIEIYHPLYTAYYYWTHGFLVDILSVMPFDIILPNIAGVDASAHTISMLRLPRLLQSIRVYNMFNFYISTTGKRIFVFIKYFLMVVFFQIVCAFYVINSKCDFDKYDYKDEIFTGGVVCKQYSWITLNHTFLHPMNPMRVYSFGIYFIAAVTTFKGLEGFTVLLFNECLELVFIVLIWFCLFPYFNAKLIASIMYRNVGLVVYQNAMATLVKFMKFRKIDPILKNEVIDHFEYIWHKKKGRNENEIFRTFNIALREDALYHIYGKVLQESSIFVGASKSFLKSLLLIVNHEIILNRGIISKVNDIHEMVFLLFKGEVEVLGPDYNKLLTLPVGSIFGQLDSVQRSRQTLSYVAKGHVEILSINSKSFHSILSRYRAVRTHFKVLTSVNVDYLINNNIMIIPDFVTEDNDEIAILNEQKKKRFKDKSTTGTYKNKKLWFLRRYFKSCGKYSTKCITFCCCHFKYFRWLKFFVKIHTRGAVLKVWEAIVLGVVCFIGPLIEFYHQSSQDVSVQILSILYLTDILFIIKIYLLFHTSYNDERGLPVKDRILIAKRYLKRPLGFPLDVTSTFPLELFMLLLPFAYRKEYVVYCRILRLLRIIMIIEFFHDVNQKLNINVLLMRLIYLMVMVILMLQFLVFFLFVIARYDTTLGHYNAYMWRNYKLLGYLNQIKVILRMFTGAQIEAFKPNNTTVILTTALLMVFSRFIIASFIAETCATLETVLHNKTSYETQVAALKKCIQRACLSMPLNSRVLLYVKLLWLHHKGQQFPSLLSEAPYYLREGVLNSMFGYHIRSHPVLQNCHKDLIRQMTAAMTTRIFFPGDFITYVGDIDGNMYFVQEGEICALSEDSLYTETVEKTYVSGQMFGMEQGLYFRCGHEYTYMANAYSVIIILNRKDWVYLLDFFPASKYLIFDNAFAKTVVAKHDVKDINRLKNVRPQLSVPTGKPKKKKKKIRMK